MRGTRVGDFFGGQADGIIPAYAGNTAVAMLPFAIYWDHPRVCGEHFIAHFAPSVDQGSSPRMRGTHEETFFNGDSTGIIPAYAGNTLRRRVDAGMRWDHPRVCGEHPYAFGDGDQFTGSSPRMRGTLGGFLFSVWFAGIIPAYAGNTIKWVSSVHMAGGSSPRMRGTPIFLQHDILVAGIIPAYAGNTLLRRSLN